MNLTWFLYEATKNAPLLITFILTIGVIFVNGWTDAPNAIATCVATRCLPPKKAIFMSAVFNFFGVWIMTVLNSKVAMTIKNMVNFNSDTHLASIALCAAMTAIIIWAVLAWYFGIPTSESHALIAGLSGAAVALQNSFDGINSKEWLSVLYGLVLSTFLGFALGFVITKIVEYLFKDTSRISSNNIFKSGQIFGGAAMSFMHGAQDGQKFMGVIILGVCLADGKETTGYFSPPFWLILLVSLVMALGTSVGGYKIIKSVGFDMVKLEKYQGFSADLSSALCLLIPTVFGIPVSTTHTKTTAIMGVGASRRLSKVNFNVVKEMVLTWILTFPGCGLLGFYIAKMFIILFY